MTGGQHWGEGGWVDGGLVVNVAREMWAKQTHANHRRKLPRDVQNLTLP